MPIWRLYNDLLVSKGRSDFYLNINIFIGGLQILMAFVLYPYGIYKMLMMYVIVNFSGLLICHHYANRVIGIRFFHVLKDILPYLFITLGIYAASYFVTFTIDNLYLRFSCKLIVPIILYCTVMILTKSVMFKESVEFLKQQCSKNKI